MLQDIGNLIKAIDDDVDWFIASFVEKDPRKRAIARYFADRKQNELAQLAKEVYERHK
ncbi:hypothetical protein ACFL0Y_03555 [Patescibacteria group bacterium]